ncbi:MAG: DUF2384 domain-containing protein [Dokdonella sp.]|uniref:antitoxin Xre/MbcA/ParS toxin-binding domain-containing protein n=1 Tax=Dokdonella sp. TaxID=2291710 RepID=UPI0025C3F43D|nr:antitoxin Xre/MbcA/ParS toxin-binding domain-containing protein [Dokdonella sp.]MBZ0222181.1 MbcA/ParS/Xre antitoxin family protein [Dokdonella sp.]MCC7255832.1 DUF2384 domain-containing protein [Dokdonella sp.]
MAAAQLKKITTFRRSLRSAPLDERMRIERQGVPADIVRGLLGQMDLTGAEFQAHMGIPKATYTKKMREKSDLDGTTGQSVLGLLELVNKVEDMLALENNPAAKRFDAARWVGRWIREPQPALGNKAPIEVMDTPSGRASVLRILGAAQSGAYQ